MVTLGRSIGSTYWYGMGTKFDIDRSRALSPGTPIRLWMEVGERDLFHPNTMGDNMLDWVVANENMAKVLAAKVHHYQFVFAVNAGHTDRAVKQQTLPEALEYLWQG